MNRSTDLDSGQTRPDLVQDIGDRVTRIIADCLASRTTQSITHRTRVEDLRELFAESLPRKGTGHGDLLDLFADHIVPHTLVSTSPGYLGLMNPTPVTMSIFADALTSLINQNQAASHHSPAGSVIEEVVIRWLGEATGYGAQCHGHLTSGGTVANMTGLKMALHRAAPEVRDRGLVAAGRRFTVYASDQLHFSIERWTSWALGERRCASSLLETTPLWTPNSCGNAWRPTEGMEGNPSPLWGSPELPLPAPSIPSRRWPTSPRRRASGFMWMQPTAAPQA